MSAAAPLSLSDPFAWLPPHMHEAARRASFGLLGHAVPRPLHALTRVWYFDGGCAVDSGIPATWPPPAGSDELTGCVCAREAGPFPVVDRGGGVMSIGFATISHAYHGFVTELWPGVTWEHGIVNAAPAERRAERRDLIPYAVALLGTRPVALVASMRARRAA